MAGARLAADIGGTFTDIAVEFDDNLHTCKVPTTPDAPEQGVLDGVVRTLEETGLGPADFSLIVHGTTLATNALIDLWLVASIEESIITSTIGLKAKYKTTFASLYTK